MDFESTAHLAPAPSYALESSEGESDYEDEQSTSRVTASQRRRSPNPDATVTFTGASERLEKGGRVVFLVGEAGERMAQGVQVDNSPSGETSPSVSVLVVGQQAGLIQPSADSTTSLVFLSTALPLAALYPLAVRVLELLQPATVTVIASYHLPSYIPPAPVTSPIPPILYLAPPAPPPAIEKLAKAGAIQPFTPPNLLHGLAAALISVSSISAVSESTLLLLVPTTTTPPPLNGPFPPTSPISTSGGASMYDAGGPTGLGDPGALFRELAGGGATRRHPGVRAPTGTAPLQTIKDALEWTWWDPVANAGSGKGFEWLERQRKERRRSEMSSMFM
ncbi:hypothetical protein BMF94_2520 [Rhodotorula taiwanensis]|uniref:Proteasome assembly chaperone 1 n=1 Tax=Rhodotorula taiwanensis TaxID=741276 RepID=A0A2S5BC19_9BASI|nr:hypothetical protein BMF94_2520 [Rhodotorula taiwanensis]